LNKYQVASDPKIEGYGNKHPFTSVMELPMLQVTRK